MRIAGELAACAGDTEHAENRFEQALQQAPAPKTRDEANLVGTLLGVRARLEASRGRRDEALKQFEQASALSVTLIFNTVAVIAEQNSLHCMVTDVEPGDVLNIRREPDPHSRKIGDIPADARPVTKLGPVRQVGGGEWWRIRYDAVTGWVNARYLSCPLSSEQTEQAVADRARDIVLALRDRDMQQFACYVHPLKGVRFSPYGYVEPDPGSEASGMDRASLRLVLEKYNDSWYAVGIIHDEWTI